MGSHVLSPPWNVVSGQNCVQLRFNPIGGYELSVQVGNFVTPETVYPVTINGAFPDMPVGLTRRFTIEYKAGKYIAVYLDGIRCTVQAGNTDGTDGIALFHDLPKSNPPNDASFSAGCGIFVTSGSLVGSTIAAFSSIQAETEM
jgi:hypothetical protein